jgi:hypothetical protein
LLDRVGHLRDTRQNKMSDEDKKIDRVINLLSLLLTINDREIIMLGIEDAVEMLKEIDGDKTVLKNNGNRNGD